LLILIAEHLAGVEWKHQDPVTGSRGVSYASGTYEAGAEFDALGVNVGRFDPFITPTLEPVMSEVPSLLAWLGVPSGRCAWDGIPLLCQDAVRLGEGAAVPCPDNDCGLRLQTIGIRQRGRVLDSYSYLVRQGQAGWDGSLDGTYRVGDHFASRFRRIPS